MQITNVGKNVEEREPSYTVVGNVTDAATVAATWTFLKRLKIKLSYDSAIPPWVCPQNHKTLIQKDTHIPNVHNSVIFNCQDVETTCPSTDEWIKKIWCIYTQWNTTQPWKRMKFCLLPQDGWIWRVLC